MGERAESPDVSLGFWGGTDDTTALRWYRTLVKTIDDGLYRLDPDGRFVAVNDDLLELTGYGRDELVGEHASELFPGDEFERIEREVRERRSTDEDRAQLDAFEVTVETAAGDAVPIELRTNPLHDADGTVRGSVGVVRERPAPERRREAAEAALESAETLTNVIDQAEVGVFVLDEEFDVAWIDETAERYFGIDRDAVVGRDKRELVEETIRHRVADGDAFAETVLETYDDDDADAAHFECRVTPGEDRAERWLEHRSKPIESGRYAGGRVELYYDVTEQYRRVQQLRRLNAGVNEWLEETSREAVAERASELLRDVLDVALNGIYLYDDESDELRPTSWTDAADAVFDELPTFSRGEGIAWRVFESGRSEIYDDVENAPNVYDPETPIRSEMVLPIGDHGVAFVSAEERDAFDDGDAMLATVAASSLEATFDRLRHERRLERERDLTDRVLDATPVGTLVLDGDGDVTRINDRAIELFEIDDPDTFAPSDRATYDETGARISVDDRPVAEALETGEPVSDRILQVELPDGDRRWLSVNAVPIPDEDGEIDRVVATSEDVTELKERERELETELNEVFDRVSDALYAVDEEFRFTYLSERAEELLGVSESEVHGKRLGEVYPETAEVERVRDAFERAMETQEPTTLEHYSELLGFWVDATIYPSESGVSVYFRDVSDRKERERELELFRTLLDTSTDSVLVVDPETGRYLDVNHTACRRRGYAREEFLEMTVMDVETELPDLDAWRSFVEDLREADSITFDGVHRRKDGSTYPVEVNASYVEFDRDYVIAIARDVTERREMERELRDREEKFRQVAENLEQVLWMTDPNKGAVIYVNPAYEDVWGRPRESLYEEPTAFLEGIHPDDRERVREALPKQRRGEYDEEYRVVRSDGSIRWVRDRAFPIEDEDGDVTRIVGLAEDVTERKERERELREAKSQLEAATEAGAVGTWEWHVPDDRFVAGASFARTFGVDPDAAREGVPLERFVSSIHEDDRERVEASIEDALESCGEYREEYRVRNGDGEYRWVVARGHVECDEDGDPITFPGALADITERKRAEQALQKTKTQLETLFEVLPVGVVVADEDGSLVRANDEAREIWQGDVFDADGVAEYDRYTGWWADTGDPVEPGEWTMARVLDGEEVADPDVFEIETAEGERRTIAVRGMPIRNGDGEVVRGVVTIADVTERREYRRKLETSERRHRTLVENFPDGAVALFDSDLEYTAVGGQYFDEVGVDPDERIGATIYETYPDDMAAKLEPKYRATLEGEECEFEVEFNGRNLRIHSVPVRDAAGEIYAGMIVAQDVTERREYQRKLEESNERLEQFAYAASHDLQEPLRMVSSYLGLLERRYGDEFDADGREFIEFAVDGAERMQAMIEGLLEYSRVETRGDPFEPIDLDAVLEDVLADLQFKIEEHDAEIEVEPLPRVDGDASQLRQVFQNLLDNAIEYSGDEPPRIRVAAERDGDEWELSVRDEGIGIDPDDVDRIFDIFQRLHSREEHAGTGIGLTLCERIVERHGGEMRVDSEPGEGSTFSFTLPAADADDA